MFPDITVLPRREKAAVFLGLSLLTLGAFLSLRPVNQQMVFPGVQPLRPVGIHSSHVQAGLKDRLMLALADPAPAPAGLEAPLDLGHLVPKGKINPDGSEVWGYPEGSELEDVLEVHVRDGRVVREVLRPSPRRSGSQMADALR